MGNLIGICIRRKLYRIADGDANASRPVEYAARLPNFVSAIDAYRKHRDFQVLRQKPDAGAKRLQLSVGCQFAFWKH